MEIRCKSISGGIRATPGARYAHIGPKCTKIDGKWSQNDAPGSSKSHPWSRSGAKCSHINSTHYLQHFSHIGYARNCRFPTHLAPHFPSFPNRSSKSILDPSWTNFLKIWELLFPPFGHQRGSLGFKMPPKIDLKTMSEAEGGPKTPRGTPRLPNLTNSSNIDPKKTSNMMNYL